ncbi:MAG: hypothetical protein ACE3JQ_05490 [Paenisporosarcina sp.]
MDKPKKVTYEEVLHNLEMRGVQFTQNKAPFGKYKNFSMMINEYKPIIIQRKKSLIQRTIDTIKYIIKR